MASRYLAWVVAGVTMLEPSAARAQEPDDAGRPLAVPARLRLGLDDGRSLTCELLRIEGDRLIVRGPGRVQGPEWSMPLADVRSAERRQGGGRGKRALKGAFIGALALAALLATHDASCGSGECFCSGSGCASAWAMGAVPAALFGGGIGALTFRERWEPVRLAASPSGPGPPAGEAPRVQVNVRIRF